MVAFSDATRDALGLDLCTALQITERGVSIGQNFYERVGFGAAAGVAEQAAQFWRNASNLFCDRPPESVGGVFNPPFTGGQCPDKRYRVVDNGFSWIDNNGDPQVNSGSGITRIGDGPLSLVRDRGGQRWRIESGTVGEFLFTADVSNDGPNATISSINPTITTNDGTPDDCGNLPDEGPQFNQNDFTRTVDITYDGPSGTETVSPTVDYRPVVTNNDGDFIVPVELDFGGDGSLIGEINITTGDINFGFNNGNNDGVQEDPVELPEGEEPEDPQLVVVGVRVTSVVDVNVTKASDIFQAGGNPTIWAPRLGHVAFLYETENGGSAWGEDIPVKNENFVAWAKRPAITAAATPNIGAQFTVSLIYDRVDPSCCCI